MTKLLAAALPLILLAACADRATPAASAPVEATPANDECPRADGEPCR